MKHFAAENGKVIVKNGPNALKVTELTDSLDENKMATWKLRRTGSRDFINVVTGVFSSSGVVSWLKRGKN